MSNRLTLFLFLAITVLALALRLPRLEQRPMHGDEAVHAVKFGALLEKNFYRYDSFEYHGPTLNYLTLIPAFLNAEKNAVEVADWTLRIVPVFFGTLLVFMPLLLLGELGRTAVFMAASFTAISPALAYYSRYYIQEMLLVCFTFGVIVCVYRYLQNKKLGWAVASGGFLGLMHATKETCIIAWGAMALALIPVLARHDVVANLRAINRRHLVVALAMAVVVSVLFFSSFFTNWRGVLDSIVTYKNYFSRAGQNPVHIHPWHYYLNILAYFRIGANPFWSETLILILAVAGFAAAMMKKNIIATNQHLLRFLAFYTLLMTIFYSLIPYKTPWNLLSFWHGMILLAGVGAAAIIKLSSHALVRGIFIAVMLIGSLHLIWQSYLANYKYHDDPANPYVYAHPVDDVFTIVKRVETIAQAHPDGHNMHVQVICPDNDYWPLPWYLRAFPNIGWWREVNENAPAAQIVIAAPQFEPALMRKFYEVPPPGQKYLYVPLFDSYMELRPQIELRGYVRKDLWDRLQASDQ
jgi:uncharacterized protein (TIGR03663 family)